MQTSELVNKLPNVFDGPSDDEDEDAEPLDSWGSLILVMLYEYLQGDKSRWKPYFNVLPHVFDTPIFWTEAELKELEGTCLTPEKIGKDESDEMLRSRILPVVLQNPDVFYLDGAAQLAEDELLRLAHRMGSTIMAYAFDLDNENEESDDEDEGWVEDREGKTLLGMVPMADILNANADFNVRKNECKASIQDHFVANCAFLGSCQSRRMSRGKRVTRKSSYWLRGFELLWAIAVF